MAANTVAGNFLFPDLLDFLFEDEFLADDDFNLPNSDVPVLIPSFFSRNEATRVKFYTEFIVPRYSISEFQSNFRMALTTFEEICEIVGNFPEIQKLYGHRGRGVIDIRKQMLITLWCLGNREAYRSIADRFDVTKSSISRTLFRICNILNAHGKQFLFWPNAQEQVVIEERFRQSTKIPGIVGAIDGCHIPIKAPVKHPETYINRKKFHSVVLQAVCDSKMVFRDVFAGWPGSVHDARVLRNSPLFRETEIRKDDLFPGDKHLLGDSAYPLLKWLLTPYRDNGHLTREQTSFNTTFSSGRQIIERAFALLKGRFRRLKYLEMNSIKNLPSVITACCILHNICLSSGYTITVDPDTDINNVPVVHFVGYNAQTGIIKRDAIMQSL